MGPDAEPAPRDRGRLGPEGDPVVAGLSLSRYAAVTAALGDSFPLADVLATLAVDAAVWPSAKPAWGVRLAGDPALFDAYKARLAAAEDRLERQLPPIDRDLGAWMSFLAAWLILSAILLTAKARSRPPKCVRLSSTLPVSRTASR